MNLTTAILDEIWDIADLTETVSLRVYDVDDDAVAASGTSVLALKRVHDDHEEPVDDDGAVPVARRRWHLRASTLTAAGVTPKARDQIVAASGTWTVESVERVAHNTRYVCETILDAEGDGQVHPAANTILTITDNGGNAMVTTAGPHGLSEAANIVVNDTSNAVYNGAQVVTSIQSPTTFLLDLYNGDSTGGTWELA